MERNQNMFRWAMLLASIILLTHYFVLRPLIFSTNKTANSHSTKVNGNQQVNLSSPIPQKNIPETISLSQKVKAIIQPVKYATSGYTLTGLSATPDTGVFNRGSILLLHGASFSADNWKEIGTLDLLASQGYNVLAINLPGKAGSSSLLPSEKLLYEFLDDNIHLHPVTIVTPSMSGQYSLPLVVNINKAGSAMKNQKMVDSLVTIAPVQVPKYSQFFEFCPQNVLIIFGENDSMISTLPDLEIFPNHQTFIIPNAGHACYIQEPDIFHQQLTSWLKTLHRDQ